MSAPARPRPPRDVWFACGAPADRRYPCRCWLGKPCRTATDGKRAPCPCWGRTDVDAMPAHCCARKHPLTNPQEPAHV
ncbi:MAG: hypothetical protein HOV79_00290 [Hamadaea sp.]|nr:hypothetical protein [Hamadaea sp.]